MEKEIKEKKLREFALSVIEYPKYKEEIDHLLSKLNLTKEEVVQAYIDYDMDIFAYENEIYESIKARMVLHLHYLLKGSWHQDRQDSLLKMIKLCNPKNAVDMGFGTLTKYIREFILKEKINLTLVDLYDSAFKFSEVLLDYLDPTWKNIIQFKRLDMNTHDYPGDFEVYIFQDSIEHVDNATDYLSKIVKESPEDSKFIFSLPVGPKVPSHTIWWDKEEDIIDWLNKGGLDIKNSETVFVNPEVDLFSEQLEEEFYNLIVLCEKKK